jgi:hypothetical protein
MADKSQQEGLIPRKRIGAAKDRLRIQELWHLLNLPGEPKRYCKSPFRDEKRASFSIFADGRTAIDYGTGEIFDGPRVLAKARGLSKGEALREFVRLAEGEVPNDYSHNIHRSSTEYRTTITTKPDLSKFHTSHYDDLTTVARDRHLDFAAIKRAHELGCLRFGRVCGFQSWLLSDPAGWCAEGRRFGRLLYPAFGDLPGRKVHTIKNSLKSWPLGLGVDGSIIERTSLFVLLEGGPDYLAAWHFILRANREDILPITLLGRAIHGVHPDALGLLAGKKLKFFPHVDPDGGGLRMVTLLSHQLRSVGCRPTYFDLEGLRAMDGGPIKDLNDLVSVDPSQASELGGLFE